MSVCPFCGDALHSFAEELEDGTLVYMIICPTCYQFRLWYYFLLWWVRHCHNLALHTQASICDSVTNEYPYAMMCALTVTSDSYIPTRTICDCVTMGSPIQIHTTHLESLLIPTITKLALLDSLIPVYPSDSFSLICPYLERIHKRLMLAKADIFWCRLV